MTNISDLIKGIDISVVQGTVDFKAVAATGVQFVICRCGVGNDGIDSLYQKNIAGAKAAGLKVMAYHFIYPLPPLASQPLRDPKAQAQMHVNAAGGELAACDLEWPATQDWAKWGCSAAQIVQWTIDYLDAYEALSGIRPIVYTYPYFAQAIKLPQSFADKYKLWIASYQTSTPSVPAPWTDWVMWQDSGGTKKLPNGVPVDTDYVKDLSLWDSTPAVEDAAPEPAVTEPVPVPTDSPVTVPEPVATPPAPAPTDNTSKPTAWLLAYQVVSGLFNKYIKK